MNKQKPTRILHITECLSAAGIESFIMNNYRRIDRKKIQFDFMVLRNQKEFYDAEIADLGGRKFAIVSNKKNTLVRIFHESIKLYIFLKKNSYEIVHIHYTTPLRALYLYAAKKAGVKVRIYHSHSAAVSDKSRVKLLIYQLMRKKINRWATHWFACSEKAAKWMYTKELLELKKVKIIYNGIDIKKFQYDPTIRSRVRDDLSINDKYVIVHTGRFLEQKNHKFIIKVFEQFKQIYPETVLLLMGNGELVDEIKEMVTKRKLDKDVIFLGIRTNVNEFLFASDCYIMPSLYEGLPVAAIEAECADLPCVLSDNITKEVMLTNKVRFLSLRDPIKNWCDSLLEFRDDNREDVTCLIKDHGYDIEQGATRLQRFYLNL